jgi:hypothetical protein
MSLRLVMKPHMKNRTVRLVSAKPKFPIGVEPVGDWLLAAEETVIFLYNLCLGRKLECN